MWDFHTKLESFSDQKGVWLLGRQKPWLPILSACLSLGPVRFLYIGCRSLEPAGHRKARTALSHTLRNPRLAFTPRCQEVPSPGNDHRQAAQGKGRR